MEPITRKELFMAKAAGENVSVPEPITREEKYLAAIVASGGGGGGSGEMVVTFTPLDENYGNFTADKTFAEITEAVTKAKFCRAVADFGGELLFGFMTYVLPGERYVFEFDEFIFAILENEISFTPLS